MHLWATEWVPHRFVIFQTNAILDRAKQWQAYGSRHNLALEMLKTPVKTRKKAKQTNKQQQNSQKPQSQISLYPKHAVIPGCAHRASALLRFNSQMSLTLPSLQDSPKTDGGAKTRLGSLISTDLAEVYPINIQQRVSKHKREKTEAAQSGENQKYKC